MTSKIYKNIFAVLAVAALTVFVWLQTGCGVYRFKDVSIPDSVHVVRVKFIENKAGYVNPTLAPRLTDKLRQKISSQTKLTQTNNDNADWDIEGTITGYSFSTSGISNQQVNMNRLNVNISLVVLDKKSGKRTNPPYTVTRSFDYSGSMSLQQAEQSLETQMLRDLTDDMFNRIFSNW